MEVIRARILGYCMGVRRAVDMAYAALGRNDGRRVFSLGPLIHNPEVLEVLSGKGLEILGTTDLDLLPQGSTVIVRAHGTSPKILEHLEEQGAKILDATCPRVHLSQKRASEFGSRGYKVVIAGDRNHGEVLSVSSYAEQARVVESAAEAEVLDLNGKCVLIAQTTFSPSEFERISEVIKRKNPNSEIFRSICPATLARQEALLELKGRASGILVIGGKNSANTRRLYESAVSIFSHAALIERATEIPSKFLVLDSVALTAGASTPDSVIDEVELSLKSSGISADVGV